MNTAMPTETTFPVVDIFAGPGGLGEGFASLDAGEKTRLFESAVSIERERHSFETLRLRHFLRSFPESGFPDEYYDYLRGETLLADLYRKFPDCLANADRSAFQISLCPQNRELVRSLIAERLKGRSRWVLLGGPPCQAYSLAGRSRMKGNPEFENDDRHFLYLEYLQLIADHAPPVFVMENVKGLLSTKVDGRFMIDRILADFADPGSTLKGTPNGLGYRLYSLSEDELPDPESTDPRLFIVKAEEFGVPQARHRMFIVGIRKDIKAIPARLKRSQPPTVRQTVGDLPAIRSGLSRGGDSFAAWLAALEPGRNGFKEKDRIDRGSAARYTPGWLERQSTRYPAPPNTKHDVLDGIYDPRLDILEGHEARSHMASDLRRYAFATVFAAETGKSPKLADFPASLLPQHSNVDLGQQGKMFSDRFRVQLPDRPSTTVTSHISKDGHYFIHYDPAQCRSMTVREAARLQTFPDNYRFEGPRTAQFHQIGNAVPPYLARQIAEIVAEVLERSADGSR